MKPSKVGQVVKFEKPLNDLEKEAKFLIREIFFDVEKPRAIVEFLDDSRLKSTHNYLVQDLEVIC